MQIFNPDSKFSQFIYSLLDYVKLGLLFLLFSIPGITAGAAAAAVMTVGMRIERKEAPVIFRPFWQAFKDNFRQATPLTLIFMLVFGFLAAGAGETAFGLSDSGAFLKYAFLSACE